MLAYSLYGTAATIVSLGVNMFFTSGDRNGKLVKAYNNLDKLIVIETSIDIAEIGISVLLLFTVNLKAAAIFYIVMASINKVINNIEEKSVKVMQMKVYSDVTDSAEANDIVSTLTTAASLLGSMLSAVVSGMADIFEISVAIGPIVMGIAYLSNNTIYVKAWKTTKDLPLPDKLKEGDNK